MDDRKKTKAQLLDELADLRSKVQQLEAIEKPVQIDEEKYRTILDNIEDGYYEVDLSGKYTFVNQSVSRYHGRSSEELIGQSYRKFLQTPEAAQEIFKVFNQVFRTGNPAQIFEYQIIRKDGEIRDLEVSASLILDTEGKPAGFRGISRDITERKKLEAEKERYREFIENINDGCYELDLKGNLTFANASTFPRFGYSREEVQGMNYTQYTSPETAQKLFPIFNEIYRTGIPFRVVEYEVIRKGGEIGHLEMSVSLIRDTKGKPVGFRVVSRDVSERKRMEAENERYRDFVENITDGCIESDLAGNTTFVNEAVCQMFGYTREELIGMNNRNRITPETAKRIFKVFNEIYRTGLPAKIFDYPLLRKDGEIRHLEVSGSLIKDQAGKAKGFRGVIRDITDRKKMEAEQERYRDFVENIADGCWEIDLAGNTTFINETTCRVMQYTREELLGMNNRAFTTPETAKQLFKVFNEIYRTGLPAYISDYHVVRKDGGTIVLELSASLIRDEAGNPVGFRGITRDITERKKMEAEQERFRDFVENITDGCWEIDLAGNITFVNESACRMMGYPQEEFLGMNNRAYTSPETAKQLVKVFNEIYRTGLPAKISDYRHCAQGWEVLYVLEMSASLIRDQAGNPIGFRGITRDITERKKMEAETVRLTEQLNQARKLEAIGTLAGGIAHDFNNLLMGIQGYTSLMLLDTDPSHPFYEKLKAVESQVRSAADLTRQLLGYARGGRYEVKATNLNELVGKTASLFGRTKKEISIHQIFAKNLWTIEADQGQLEQVLLNLFMNAWQAMPGGGALYLQTENVWLDESYVEPYETAPGPFVKLSVTDTGIGMDRETKERIFEPFFTTKEMGRGTGLGLASTYGIIRGHKGIITVYSEKGYGTTFNIYLPSSQKEALQEIQLSREIMKVQGTLLLVDDEKTIIEVTGGMITRLGYQLLIAHSGEEAVEIYQANSDRIDLVIMDMIMPGIGGGEAFDLIKSINPQVKIILSSGFNLNGAAKRS